MPTRVLIADDEPAVRAFLRAALEAHGFEICSEVADADSAVGSAIAERPDVALLDIRMPGNGIAAARAIGDRLPDVNIVMLTASTDEQDLFDALKAGACGYLQKGIDAQEIPRVLNAVVGGDAVLSPKLTARLIQEFRRRGDRRVATASGDAVRLTPKEWEVLELMRDGLSTSAIAERMFVAPVTIRSHIAAILKKLKVSSREEALRALDEA